MRSIIGRSRKPVTATATVASDAPDTSVTVATPDTTPAVAAAPRLSASLARRDATVAGAAYPFLETSDRDRDYHAFYAYAAAKHPDGFTLADLAALGERVGKRTRNPFSNAPSASAADAGAAERAIKRGVLIRTERDGIGFYSLPSVPDLAADPDADAGQPAAIIAFRNDTRAAIARAAARA